MSAPPDTSDCEPDWGDKPKKKKILLLLTDLYSQGLTEAEIARIHNVQITGDFEDAL